MMRPVIVLLFSLSFSTFALAQSDSTKMAGIFAKVMNEMQTFKVDTSAVPDDKKTARIRSLMELGGGFNIHEAIEFKLEEDASKNTYPPAELQKLREAFTNGNARRWLDNAIIHMYRDQFTAAEIKRMVKFYKTSAGKKLVVEFPMIMLKSLATAQTIQQWLTLAR